MARVIVGMSGGVDSAVAAYLLREAGHEVIGVTLRTWESGGSRCCEIDDARETARMLSIPFHVLSCVSTFQKQVEAPFAEAYLRGVTPNPCVVCNRAVKWEWMLYASRLFQADAVATGHYAGVAHLPNGRFAVRRAGDERKDQSYMLCRLTQEQLSRTMFPLQDLTKEEVRYLAERTGLPSAHRPDSQEVCFVAQGSYADYIASRTDRPLPGPGRFVDEQRRVLGTHRGVFRYTVGQRRGLGLALGYHAYVTAIHPERNEVVIGRESSLYRGEILCHDLIFQSTPGLSPGESLRAAVKIRYAHEGAEASVQRTGADTLRIGFDRPVRAPAPGQTAVLYDADGCVIAAGTIAAAPDPPCG